MSKTVYVTTPIYYVNDRPHIGHTYTTTVCDVYARFQRFAGMDVFFLTGTDEHGIKVEKSAREKGVTPQALADENAAEFQRVLSTLHLTNDDFIRTTQPDHLRQVEAFVGKLLETGDVYLGEFEGWYDEGQEEYYTETQAKKLEYASPISGKPLVRSTEHNYFFRLSAYQERLEKLFADHPEFVRPEALLNEVLGRMREGLQDVPMTRTNFTWGIPMPGDPEHVIYVWIEARMNYATALGLGEPGGERYAERHRYWPATYHVIGKEILWFHAVIWPAMLIALELPLPQTVYAHSFYISEGQKMSKSLGNFIDLETIEGYVDAYGLDALRYYLATQGPLGANDANFTAAHLHETYTTDLVNTLGNCSSRVTAMLGKYFDGTVPDPGARTFEEYDWPTLAAETIAETQATMDHFELGRSIAAAMQLVRRVDAFINETQPFKLARDESRRGDVAAILYQCIETLRIASLPLWATLPEKMAAFWAAIGNPVDPAEGRLHELATWGGMQPGQKVEKVALFPRVEEKA